MSSNNYTTIQGETWDLIAYKLWGSENLVQILFDANTDHKNTLFFKGGIVLNVPDVEIKDYTIRPEWMGEDDEL